MASDTLPSGTGSMDEPPSVPSTEVARAPVPPEPYWAKPGSSIAPIKSEYILWDLMKGSHRGGDRTVDGISERVASLSRDYDDDAAEGRQAKGTTEGSEPKRSANVASEEKDLQKAKEDGKGENHNPEASGEPAEKRVRLSGAQKKAAARERQAQAWQDKIDRRKAKKEASKGNQEVLPIVVEGSEGNNAAAEKERTTEDVEGKGGRSRGGGQNTGRRFDHQAGMEEIRLCPRTAVGEVCNRPGPVESGEGEGKDRRNGHMPGGRPCRLSHDLSAFLEERLADIPIRFPEDSDNLAEGSDEGWKITNRLCPLFEELGKCPYGFKCRFLNSHLRKADREGGGVLGSQYELIADEQKVKKIAENNGEGLTAIREKGEMNVIYMDKIKEIRGQGLEKENRFPLSTAYLMSIGEPLDQRKDGRDGGKGDRWNEKGGNKRQRTDEQVVKADSTSDLTAETLTSTAEPVQDPESADMLSDNKKLNDPDSRPPPDLAPYRASEKKRLDFAGKLYLAPLTTVGNLPFRRLCNTLGNDISCSEMGLAQEFLSGNKSEWSLVRRHPSERMFGVQICGAKPQVLVPTAEAIVKSCSIDFLDVNCGCPIDLVFNKGAGSALLQHAGKLGKSLVGMSKVLGEVPLTIKIRNGVVHSQPTAHKLVTRMQGEWGISAVTLHGRSRQQRYKNAADYKYIAQVAKTLRETASDEGLAPIPIFGNGDAYDYRTYYDNMEQSGVDGIMIARGALIKPWIFTEIKERRDWDISSRERLDLVGNLAQFGIEHWGSDTLGLNTTRRFLCEALSFQHRYVPVGLLERFPASMSERALPYRGRDQLETLLASDKSSDWVKITSMFLGPPPEGWNFLPKHKANATDNTEVQG